MEIIGIVTAALFGAATYVFRVRPALDERATKQDMAK